MGRKVDYLINIYVFLYGTENYLNINDNANQFVYVMYAITIISFLTCIFAHRTIKNIM